MALLEALTGWRPDREFLLGPLRKPKQQRLLLSHFPVGIDHYRIDVRLDPELRRAASALVRQVLREDVQRTFWRVPIKVPNPDAGDAFRDAHIEVTKGLLQRGNPKVSLGRAQLYQLALIKWLLETVDHEFEDLHEEVQHAREHLGARSSGEALRLHDRLVTLTKHGSSIRYRATSHVMRMVSRTELGTLRKYRKSVLGISWPLAERLLFNPLLQLRGFGDDDEFAAVYPILFYDLPAFSEVNRIVLQVLRPWLPGFVGEPDPHVSEEAQVSRVFSGPTGFAAVERRLRQAASSSEYQPPRSCWLDHWENLTTLLGGTGDNWPQTGPWRHPRWPSFQAGLRKTLQVRIEQAGLMPSVLAADQLTQLYPALGPGQARFVFNFLSGQLSRKDCVKRLAEHSADRDVSDLMQRLDAASRAVRRPSRAFKQRTVVRTLGHFARLRRDLKTSWQAMSAMATLRLAHDQETQTLSQANGLLQSFHAPGNASGRDATVIGHVIVKVDVRGSTQLTTSMQEAELNPAAYFSRNLFAPIEGLLQEYDAKKVFIEGDAVILIIHEHPGENGFELARACGLAKNILRVVDATNDRNGRLGLPALELGLGVAYESGPPAYLFDGKRRITISSAINRADRLSSCHSRLRSADMRSDTQGRGVEVVEPERSDSVGVKWADDLVRYNVNGIALDADAFVKLRSELKLHGVAPSALGESRFFAGRYPDARGNMHWLAVREAPIRVWSGAGFAPGGEDERRFYEVVTDRDQLAELRAQLAPLTARGNDLGSRRQVN